MGFMFVVSIFFLGGMEFNWFLGIEFNVFGCIGVVVNFIVVFVVLWVI